MRDMHIHTEFSCDSEAKMEDIGADYAIAKGLLEEIGLEEVIYRQRKRLAI